MTEQQKAEWQAILEWIRQQNAETVQRLHGRRGA